MTTASIKEREGKLCDREDVEDQEIKLENKEEQLNQLRKHLESERELKIRQKDRQAG